MQNTLANFTESFTRGVGKTCGALVVCGLATGLFYTFYLTSSTLPKQKRKQNKSQATNTEDNASNTENPDADSDMRFKKIFDNI